MRQRCALILLMLLAGVQCSWASSIPFTEVESPYILNKVPNYYQSTNGCAPTTAAIILGYWDLHGYDSLFDASGWGSSSGTNYTVNVLKHIDDLADRMETSTGDLPQGWTYIDKIRPGIEGYTASRGYTGTSAFQVNDILAKGGAETLWDAYMYEIKRGNPVFLLVDSDKDGGVDHAVAGIGYGMKNGQNLFASYYSLSEDEKDTSIQWFEFLPMAIDRSFGLYNQMITVHPPGLTPTPEPATILLFASGITAIAGLSRRRKASIAGATTL